jgi:hypothetical protein
MNISDEKLKEALSLFRESALESRPETVPRPARSFAWWRIAAVAFAVLALLIAIPLYRHQQQ